MTKPPSETPAAPLSPDEISQIRERADAVPEKYWRFDERTWVFAHHTSTIVMVTALLSEQGYNDTATTREIARNRGRFTANALVDVRRLLATVADLRARNEALANWQARTKEREEHLHVAGHPTQEEIPPYTPDEKRVVDYITRDGTVGGGGDPIGFLISSHNYVNGLRQEADARIAELTWMANERLRAFELLGVEYESLKRRAESLERRNHDLAQDLHRADAVIEWLEVQSDRMPRAPWTAELMEARDQAIERHRAARATPAPDVKEKEDG